MYLLVSICVVMVLYKTVLCNRLGGIRYCTRLLYADVLEVLGIE